MYGTRMYEPQDFVPGPGAARIDAGQAAGVFVHGAGAPWNDGPGTLMGEGSRFPIKEPVMAMHTQGAQPIFDLAALDTLVGAARGEILTPASPGYDDARKLYNGMIDKRPAVIV